MMLSEKELAVVRDALVHRIAGLVESIDSLVASGSTDTNLCRALIIARMECEAILERIDG